MRSNYSGILAVVLFLLSATGNSQNLYGIVQNDFSKNYLASVNPLSGIVNVISTASLSSGTTLGGSTLDPIHKRFYYLGHQDSIFMVDLLTGNMITRKKLSSSGSYVVAAIEFNRRDSLLYAIATSTLFFNSTYLARINPFTGSVSVLSSTLSVHLQSGVSALDPINGLFFYSLIANFKDTIYTVDINTATVLSRKTPAVSGTILSASLEFNDADASLYALRQSSAYVNYITKMNPFTGTGNPNMTSATVGGTEGWASSFDPVNNWYFYLKGGYDTLVVVDVQTGAVIAKNKIISPGRLVLIEYEKPFDGIFVGIKNNKRQVPSFSLFPNPASRDMKLISGEVMNSFKLVIYSEEGKPVKEFRKINGAAFGFSVEDLPAGNYLASLFKENRIFGTQKLIITD